jgi:hypothetical protein
MEGTSRPLRTATYVLRFTEEEKKELEAKVERAASQGRVPLTLAHALRMGAKTYLDEMLASVQANNDATGDDGLGA